LAARSENIDLFKKNHKKKIILIDRFVDSTIAYQHYGFGIDLNLINLINSHILNRFKVDFTFLNIIDQKNMIKRLKSRKSLNRYDKFKQKFYLKVQNGFLTIAKKNKKKYKIIDSNLDKKVNKLLVINELEKLL
tara:strand:- start:481 stop:882 length:402 start_codon:yes stop_codon:yes gene_type:complete